MVYLLETKTKSKPNWFSDYESQNCVKAAIAFVCTTTTCNRQLLFALLQLITFLCTIAFVSTFWCLLDPNGWYFTP